MAQDEQLFLKCLISYLVVLSTFLNGSQPNDRLTVLQSLVKNDVGVALDLVLLPFWSFVVFLHLFPLYALQGLEAERENVMLLDQQQNLQLHFKIVNSACFLTSVMISLAKILFPSVITMLMNLLKDKNDHLTWVLRFTAFTKHMTASLSAVMCVCCTWGLGRCKQSCWLHWLLPWWVGALWAPAAPSPEHSAPSLVCCRPPSWPLAPDSKGCICSTSPGALCKQRPHERGTFHKLLTDIMCVRTGDPF